MSGKFDTMRAAFQRYEASSEQLRATLSKPRVLYVEDDENSRRVIREALGDHFDLVFTDCPDEARRLVGVLKCRVAVVDSVGFEAVPTLRGAGLPVVLATGSERAYEVAAENGIHEARVFKKPFNVRALVATLRALTNEGGV